MEFSTIFETIKGFFEANVLPTLKPIIDAIMGLIGGIIGGKYPNMDMISCGPTIKYPHSPDEKVNIASVEKFWKFLCHTLETIPVK